MQRRVVITVKNKDESRVFYDSGSVTSRKGGTKMLLFGDIEPMTGVVVETNKVNGRLKRQSAGLIKSLILTLVPSGTLENF